MIYTILQNVIILLLTIIGLFKSKSPIFLIIASAVLMIWITYQSFCEEKTNTVIIVNFTLMWVFSLLSGDFIGFLVFFFLEDLKPYVRVCLGTMMFVFSQLAIFQNISVAMCMLRTIFLLTVFLFLGLLYSTIEWGEKRKIKERQRVVESNISELHEKRLNEQLIMRKYVDERNARLLERENISRNIHNSVGHSITAAIMTLDAADMLYDVKPQEARKKMNDANIRIRGSLESIRRAVRVLDEDNIALMAKELKAELDMIITEFIMDTSIKVRQNYKDLLDDIVIPHDHTVFLTGVLQEVLTNGVKHGDADEFLVVLLGDSAHVRLEVSDNGHSDFSDANSKQKIEYGFGLKKIISYVEKCGGKTLFENDNGFKTTVEIPIVFGG